MNVDQLVEKAVVKNGDLAFPQKQGFIGVKYAARSPQGFFNYFNRLSGIRQYQRPYYYYYIYNYIEIDIIRGNKV